MMPLISGPAKKNRPQRGLRTEAVVPQRFFRHGQHARGDRQIYASRTRFIPDRLLGLFEKTVWPMAIAGAAARLAS
jgi:DNA helicase-2/ATP-dependent DNA helicase PcrA